MSECEVWMQDKLLIKMMQKNNTHLFFHYLLQRSRFNWESSRQRCPVGKEQT